MSGVPYWQIDQTPAYKKYNSWEERPEWWREQTKDEHGHWIIMPGEVWCRIKNEDDSWCFAPVSFLY
jgi:hypothetical protein